PRGSWASTWPASICAARPTSCLRRRRARARPRGCSRSTCCRPCTCTRCRLAARRGRCSRRSSNIACSCRAPRRPARRCGSELARSLARSLAHSRIFAGCGQLDDEAGSVTGSILERQSTAVLGHDPVADREPEPGPLIAALGGEERVEDAPDDVLGDAAAAVVDPDAQPLAILAYQRLGADADLFLVAVAREALVERVACVDHQIHQHLLNLLGTTAQQR